MRNRFLIPQRLLLLQALLIATICSWAAERHVTISVVDEMDQPLPGALVSIYTVNNEKGKVIGATDVEGVLSTIIPDNVTSLSASFIGYKNKKIAITGSKEYKIQLDPSTHQLEDVVITGYQTLSKERMTGSFAKVDKKEIETKPVSSISSLLEGNVAGYDHSTGLIRGVTSMNAIQTPLYVIDGFPVENTRVESGGTINEYLPSINMNDVESITVLKDAAAASIYGARAANGVVVITTKSGSKTKKPQIEVNAQLRWTPYKYFTGFKADSETTIDLYRQMMAVNPNFQGEGATEYAQSCIDLRAYPGAAGSAILNYLAGNITESQMNSQLDDLSKRGYQFYDQIAKYAKRTALEQNYNMTIKNSNEKNNFKASLSYVHNDYNDINSTNNRFGIDLYNSLNITNWLKFDIGTYIKYSNSKNSLGSAWWWNGLPFDRLVNDDGSYYTMTMEERYNKDALNMYSIYNLLDRSVTPLEEMNLGKATNNELYNRTIGRITITFAPWLNYTAALQYERSNSRYENLQDKNSDAIKGLVNNFSQDTGNEDGSVNQWMAQKDKLTRTDYDRTSYNFRQQLNFDKTFNSIHDVTVILGTETKENKNNYFNDEYYEWDPQLLSFKVLDYSTLNSAGIQTIWGKQYLNDVRTFNEVTDRFVSIYGNASYRFDGKYNLTGSIRWDRSNLWGTGSDYQKHPFWSLGASWLISGESFMNDLSWINYLRLRASDGVGGNVSKTASPYMIAKYQKNSYLDYVDAGFVLRLPNPNLRWEQTNTFNIGLDFALFNNRLNGSLEYYHKYSKDLLSQTETSPVTGYSTSQLTNSAEMKNTGIELSLNGTILTTADWNWTAGFIFSTNHNRVTKVKCGDAPYLSLRLQNTMYGAYPVEGKEYYSCWAYRFAGLNEEGLPQIYDGEGNKIMTNPASTDWDAVVYVGTRTPKWTGSFNTNVTWKNITLSAQLVFQGGNVQQNSVTSPFLSYSNSQLGYFTDFSSISSVMEKAWKQPGDENHTNIPATIIPENAEVSISNLKEIYNFSDINYLKMDYLKVGNIALAYRLPKEWCRKIHFDNVRIQANIDNPFLFARSKEAKYLLGGYNASTYTLGIFVDL